MIEDPRKTALKMGLRQLNVSQLERVLMWEGDMCLDTHNYHEGKYCPLAIAVGLPYMMVEPTNEKVFTALEERGFKINNTKGVEGEFYTTNRLADLRIAALEVIKEKETV
jgi:hypothetical protein